MDYTVVYDVIEGGYRQWRVPAFGFVLTAIGILLLFFRRRLTFGPACSIIVFSVLWITLGFIFTFCDYWALCTALQKGRCQVVEGTVTSFDPMPEAGHRDESFIIDGHRFAYSDYNVTAGFHNARSNGGPINNGLRVRIHYVGTEIARLEIAY